MRSITSGLVGLGMAVPKTLWKEKTVVGALALI